MKLALVLAFVVLMSGIAAAVTTDSVLITVTPMYALSVNIVQPTTSFGIVPLRSSKSVKVGAIENDGEVSSHWEKKSANSSGGWTIDTDGLPGQNAFSLIAITTTTGVTPNFAGTSGEGDGSAGDSILHCANQDAAYVTEADDSDLVDGAGSANAPNVDSANSRDLWVSIMMPSDITIGTIEQTITLSVIAEAPN